MTNNNCGIYCIENKVDGKKYIGQSIRLNKREKEHFSLLRLNKHDNKYLQRAFKKYGEDNFKFLVLEFCKFEELDEKETYWILFYNTFLDKTKGYNLDSGGSNSKNMSEESKKKMSDAKKGSIPHNKGVSPSQETLKKQSISQKEVWKKDGYRSKMSKSHLGNKASNETKQKMSLKRLGKKISVTIKKIISNKNLSIMKQGKRNLNNKYSSEYIGVCKIKTSGKWQATICYMSKSIYIGNFDLEIDAAKAYDKKAIELFGKNAKTNF